jgi:hypothetical protein
MGKHIEIRLALQVVAPLVDFILPLLDPDSADLPATPDLGAVDHEIRESWHDDLLESYRSEMQFFKDLFGPEFRETGVLEFPEESCEAVVRACASARLKLRTDVLKSVNDEALEGGDLDYDSLGDEERTGFMAYVFLASFQEILIRHMDPGIAEA